MFLDNDQVAKKCKFVSLIASYSTILYVVGMA